MRAGLCAVLIWIGALSGAHACSLEVNFSGQFTDRQLLTYLRCLNAEVAAVKRENRLLRERVSELERIAAELPATYANIDGEVLEEPGRAIGRASFTLSARTTGGPSALPVEQRVLEELCSVRGGCQMSLSFRQFGLFDDAPKKAVIAGPCAFSYKAETGEWVTGSGCDPAGPRNGVDGDQVAALDAEGGIIAEIAGACLFTESAPKREIASETRFERDHAPGLFLVSIPALQPDGIRRFQCELVLN